MSVTLEPPRWRNGPPICPAENLPAFPSQAAAVEFNSGPARTNPNFEPYRIKRLWKCDSCDQWHFIAKMRPPSGGSSGSSKR